MRMSLRAWKEMNSKCTRYHDWMEEEIQWNLVKHEEGMRYAVMLA